MPQTRITPARMVRAGGGLAAIATVAIGATLLAGAGPGTEQPAGPGSSGNAGDSATGLPVDLSRVQPVLTTFSGCDPLLDYYRSHAVSQVGPYGLPGNGPYPMRTLENASAAAGGVAVPAPAAAQAAAGGAPTAGKAADTGTGAVGATSAGGTNVQVAGVDEADVSKRAGDLVLTVATDGQRPGLVVLRTGSGTATVLARLGTGDWSPTSLLVDGDHAVLIGQSAAQNQPVTSGSGVRKGIPQYLVPRTRVMQVDLADPAHPRSVGTLDLDGALVGARMVDGVVRLAVDSSLHPLPFVSPQYPQANTAQPQARLKAAEDAATAANRAVVRDSVIGDWLPTYTLRRADGTSSQGRLVDCADVSAPSRFSGLDTLSLVSVDLRAGGVQGWQSAAVIASGSTLYATADRTYLATGVWGAGARQTTQIHVFDTAGRSRPRYLASGELAGQLLDQFSMDEFGGDLRVATTTMPSGPIAIDAGVGGVAAGGVAVGGVAAGGVAVRGPEVDVPAATGVSDPLPPDSSAGAKLVASSAPERTQPVDDSAVTVLRRKGDRLVQVGRVAGMGRGERIYAVRFIGPVGYVVTFRQTDPLYTVDLSRPTAPRVAGELKLLGYSAYLHPAGDGRLLGIGQAADAAGHVQGLQLSLFDVHDPARPARLAQVKLPDTFSDAQNDHHAFTVADGLVLIPFQRYGFAEAVGAAPQAGDGVVSSPPQVGYQDAGVVGVRLAGSRFAAPAFLRMQGNGPVRADQGLPLVQPLRTYVDGGAIWTVTGSGLGVHDEQTLHRLAFVRY